MCRHGHPGSKPNGVRKLYDEVLVANTELQQIWHKRPPFLRADAPIKPEWPASVVHLRRAFTISFARSVSPGFYLATSVSFIEISQYFTIHRHFQLKSFRDDAYSVTRVSRQSRTKLPQRLTMHLDILPFGCKKQSQNVH